MHGPGALPTGSLLITGAYGTGKTTLAAELAELLAERRHSCAAIDVDWLGWFWLPGDRPHTLNDIVLTNLRDVVANYVRAGVQRFALAGTIRSRPELDQLRDVVPAPLKVVRLTVPLVEIERRLRADALSSRLDDLRESAADPAAGSSIADLTLANVGPIADLARHVLDWWGQP
jgi:cellulose biosynthesis protein BcsQ